MFADGFADGLPDGFFGLQVIDVELGASVDEAFEMIEDGGGGEFAGFGHGGDGEFFVG